MWQSVRNCLTTMLPICVASTKKRIYVCARCLQSYYTDEARLNWKLHNFETFEFKNEFVPATSHMHNGSPSSLIRFPISRVLIRVEKIINQGHPIAAFIKRHSGGRHRYDIARLTALSFLFRSSIQVLLNFSLLVSIVLVHVEDGV